MTAERHPLSFASSLPHPQVLRLLSVTAADWGLAAYAPRMSRRPRWRRLPVPAHAAPTRPATGFLPMSFAV